MPELPEVETTCQGIKPYLEQTQIQQVIVRQPSLRWPIDPDLPDLLNKQVIQHVERRAKYILLQCENGILLIHLGMSGSLRVLPAAAANTPNKHDHVDIILNNDRLMRYTDPRRFGAILWTSDAISEHPLISHLGPEPLEKDFNSQYLYQQSRGKRCSIKTLIMNGKVVVGVGNIYANESLFLARIHPKTPAQALTQQQYDTLTTQIKCVLTKAIKAGGTTLKDFTQSDGKPGYFAQQLNVYGRKDEPCLHCGSIIQHYKETQRATFYCPLCQSS